MDKKMDKELIKTYRSFLKDSVHKAIDFSQTDLNRKITPPPVEKTYTPEAKRIDLPQYDQLKDIGEIDLKKGYQKPRKPQIIQPSTFID